MFDAALVAHNAWNTAPAYDYFSADNTLLAGGLTLGIDALELGAGSVVAVDLTATTGETESDGPLPHYVSRSSLRRTDVGFGLSLRHHVWSWLAPHVRLSGAAAFETAKVRSPDFPTLEVSETNFVGGVGAGFSLYSAAKRIHSTRRYVNSLAFRLTAEGGYQLVGDIPFEVPKSAPSGSIPRRAISLGKLEQSGPYLRISAGAHF